MSSSIVIRARRSADYTDIKVLITHPMETGLRRDTATRELIPEHYITDVVCELNNKVVMRAAWGRAISKDPFIGFRIKEGAPGDKIKISWTDNKNNSDSLETTIN